MRKTAYRPLRMPERQLLNKLLEKDFEGRNEIINQLKSATARLVFESSNGSLEFKVNSPNKANARSIFPVIATAKDQDGVQINLFLHVYNGIVNELEISKNDGTKLGYFPHPSEVMVNVNL